jgi:hypothetical protein
LDESPAGYKVFLHIEGPSGGRFIADHAPPRPFESLQKGDALEYTRKVAIPDSTPPGNYTLWLGLFKGNQRLPAKGKGFAVDDNRANLGTIRVE